MRENKSSLNKNTTSFNKKTSSCQKTRFLPMSNSRFSVQCRPMSEQVRVMHVICVDILKIQIAHHFEVGRKVTFSSYKPKAGKNLRQSSNFRTIWLIAFAIFFSRNCDDLHGKIRVHVFGQWHEKR
jgi:hypothetical protein